MAGGVLLRRTFIIGLDTLIAVIAILEAVIKVTFYYASTIDDLIVTAKGEVVVIVS